VSVLALLGLVVSTGNRGGEISVSGDHEESDIGLRSSGDHVLDKVTMSRGIDDGVVFGGGEKFLGGARNGDTSFSLLLLTVHVERKGERTLSESVSLFSELGHFSLRDSTEFENQTSGGGRFTGIDVSTDDNRNVLLSFSHLEK